MTLELPGLDRRALETFLLALADDDFLLGHRLSYWVARGPTIEADNEMAAIVQDELGHARLWYELLLEDDGPIESVAFDRPASARRNSVLVERPVDDFGEMIVRQFLYDRAEGLLLDALADGTHGELASRAEVARREEEYHRDHADLWLDRLSETADGRGHLEAAFEACLPPSRDLFAFERDVERALVDAGVIARPFRELHTMWIDTVVETLSELPLDVDLRASPIEVDAADVPDALEGRPDRNGRAGEHTDALETLLEGGLSTF